MLFPSAVTTFVTRSCLLKGFAKPCYGNRRLCQTDETQQGWNSCPWLSDTSSEDMVERKHTVMATPRGWREVCPSCFPWKETGILSPKGLDSSKTMLNVYNFWHWLVVVVVLAIAMFFKWPSFFLLFLFFLFLDLGSIARILHQTYRFVSGNNPNHSFNDYLS